MALVVVFAGGGSGTAALDALSQLSGLNGQQAGGGSGAPGKVASECRTGADAERTQDCRIVGYVNSIQAYWQKAVRGYKVAPTVFFTGHTETGCGAASSQAGPLDCPADQRVYIDLGFFEELQTRFGAQGGRFAEAYVLAHEYGHHVQNLLGTLKDGKRRPGCRKPERQNRTASRLFRRSMGRACRRYWLPDQGHSGRYRHRARRRCGGRRRQDQRIIEPGKLDPRLSGTAPALVHHRLSDRRAQQMRHIPRASVTELYMSCARGSLTGATGPRPALGRVMMPKKVWDEEAVPQRVQDVHAVSPCPRQPIRSPGPKKYLGLPGRPFPANNYPKPAGPCRGGYPRRFSCSLTEAFATWRGGEAR